MDGTYSVYIHINKTNGKRYVGMTGDVKKRWHSNGAYYSAGPFKDALKKYGWDGFDHVVYQTGLSKEEAAALEISLIELYDTTNPNKGYNVSSGGPGWRKDGHCSNEEEMKRIKRKYYEEVIMANPERHQQRIEQAKKYREKNKDNEEWKEKQRERQREYRNKNKDNPKWVEHRRKLAHENYLRKATPEWLAEHAKKLREQRAKRKEQNM